MPRTILFLLLSIALTGCDKKEDSFTVDHLSDKELNISLSDALAGFARTYGVYVPQEIGEGQVFVRRFEWLETSDTYFMRFVVNPEEFNKFERSASDVLGKDSLSKVSSGRSKRKCPPDWFISDISEGFKAIYRFERTASSNNNPSNNLDLYVEVDTSNENTYIIYIYCNEVVKW